MHIPVTIFLLALSSISAEQKWTGNWFPVNPEETPAPVVENTNTTEKWNGKWFPSNPNKVTLDNTAETNSHPENSELEKKITSNTIESGYHEKSVDYDRKMGIANSGCDDGETNLQADFDPSSADHAKFYTCLEVNYKPNAKLEPIETIYDVPKFYTPVHKCMNETITYDQHIPTLGSHRPLWPEYGEYTFVPPQRWLHSLEHGAIVMLYDPCALKSEVDKLRNLVKKCLFRHVITPYRLSSERPLALVGWAASLEMSVFDDVTAIEFIKKYAKSGPEKVSRQGQYKKMLIDEAKIVSDQDDSELCPDKSTIM